MEVWAICILLILATNVTFRSYQLRKISKRMDYVLDRKDQLMVQEKVQLRPYIASKQ